MHLTRTRRLKAAISVLVANDNEYDWNTILENLGRLEGHLEQCVRQQDIDREGNAPDYHGLFIERINTGPNRPQLGVDMEIVDYFRERRFSWKEIAQILGISQRTLKRRCDETQFEDPMKFADITHNELVDHVKRILDCMPKAGVKIVHGALRGQGKFIRLHER